MWLVMRAFPAVVPGDAGVTMYRPGDLIEDTDPRLALLQEAAPVPGLVHSWPSGLPDEAIAQRLRGVPDEDITTFCLAAWAAWC